MAELSHQHLAIQGELNVQQINLKELIKKQSIDVNGTEIAQLTDRIVLLEKNLGSSWKLSTETKFKHKDIQDQLEASMRILIGWLPFQGWLETTHPVNPNSLDSKKTEQEKLKNTDDLKSQKKEEYRFRNKALHNWAQQVLQGLSAYLLPMIYGLVGACAFVLRSMSKQIRDLTFSGADSTVQYMLRLVLGVLAGISIGWFLKPDPSPQGLVSSISPLAVAFVAGYSVEMLFTAMDKVITAFTGRGPGQPKTQTSG
ncbi:MAG: hypothetical protein GY799_18760 [Desulfobulbaceae bacterium]|nr:hypothetical protein [Desulfobulbaceae bacterium]